MDQRTPPPSSLITAIEHQLKRSSITWKQLFLGYSDSQSWIITFSDGFSCFAKAAVDERTTTYLQNECGIYETVDATFLPTYYGKGMRDGYSYLLLEDLSTWHWPPPWSAADIEAVKMTLERVAAASPLPELPRLSLERAELEGWHTVAKNPTPFLMLDVCSKEWFDQHISTLLEAEQAMVLEGESLIHWDIRGDNICIKEGQIKIVDWNHARRGNKAFDFINWLPNLYLEGGPEPWNITLDQAPIIVQLAGYYAAHAPRPPRTTGPAIRLFQRRQLAVALPWACRALHLPLPA